MTKKCSHQKSEEEEELDVEDVLLETYNQVLKGRIYLPEEWITQIVIPTLKHKKDPNAYSS